MARILLPLGLCWGVVGAFVPLTSPATRAFSHRASTTTDDGAAVAASTRVSGMPATFLGRPSMRMIQHWLLLALSKG